MKDADRVLFTVSTPQPVTAEEIDNLLSAAFDGGSNYWIDGPVYPVGRDYGDAEYASQAVSRGKTLEIRVKHGYMTLSLREIEERLPLFLAHIGETWRDFYDNHDANDADNFLQFCLFGKLVYC